MKRIEKIITLDNYPVPYTDELEKRILAVLLHHPDYATRAMDLLGSGYFFNDNCLKTWEVIMEHVLMKKTFDIGTVSTKIPHDFLVGELMPMYEKCASDHKPFDDYVQLLRLQTAKRVSYESALKLVSLSSDPDSSLPDLMSGVDKLHKSIVNAMSEESDANDIVSVVNAFADEIQTPNATKRVPTGLKSLDKLTYGGFAPGNLIILAARPSVGKTAVALHIARNAAKTGVIPNIFSLEMTNSELVQRFIVGTGLVSQKDIIHGSIDWTQFEKAVGIVSMNNMFMYDRCFTFEEISTRILLNCQQGKCGIAIVDYLGLLQTRGNKPLYQEIAEYTKGFKRLAKECRIPILLLCQFNRMSENEKRPPQLIDLRDSGAIEQDADGVLMLEKEGESKEERRRIRMWVRKNRQGRAGDILVRMEANETFTEFSDRGLFQIKGKEFKSMDEEEPRDVSK